jgi:hypothetical protein
MAISAKATSRPPSEQSWQAWTGAREDLRSDKSPFRRSAARSTGGGAPSSRPAISRSQRDWPSQPAGLADQHQVQAGGQGEADRLRHVLQHADAADGGGGEDGAGSAVRAARLVVEGDVAGHDGEVERRAGGGHAADAGGELAHDLRALGVAEVHVVRDRERAGADGGDVAPASATAWAPPVSGSAWQ